MSLLRRSPRLAVAGALLTGGFVALAASPASAVGVSTEVELRAAFADPGQSSVVLTANIDLVDCAAGDVTRPVTANVLNLSGPFTIRQTCAGERVIGSDDDPAGSVGRLGVSGVTITGGSEVDAVSAVGGGIAWDGDVVLDGAVVTGNVATSPFGALGGGVFATGQVLVNGSTISDNVAGSNGDFGGLAGALNAGTGAVITDSTLSGNLAMGGAKFGGTGGAIFGNSNVVIVRSTVAANAATVSTDGTSGGNGGGVVINGDLEVYDSTVTSNTATGATSSNGGLAAGGDTTIAYSTIVGNSAASQANLQGLNNDPTFGVDVLFATVISDPLGGGTNCGVPSDPVSQGYNYADDASCNLTATGDRQAATDPLLGALSANGGPTRTRLPAATSPLLDAIPAGACLSGAGAGIVADQRGVARPQGTGCDIGAVEVVVTAAPSTTTTTAPDPATTTPGSSGRSPAATPVRVTPTFTG